MAITQPNYQTYLAKALPQVETLYKPIQDQTTSYYDTLKGQLATNLQNEYNKRGILNSGLYGQAVSQGNIDLAGKQAAAMSELQLKKLAQQNSLASNEYSMALDQWKAEREAERENQQYQRELALARAKGSGSGRRATASETKAAIRSEVAANALQYVKSGAWKNKFDTEKNFLPSLYSAYGELKPNEINDIVYRVRKPYE